MMVHGNLCLHIEDGGEILPPSGYYTLTDLEGNEVWRSEKVPLEGGNKLCYGPICVECEPEAVFSHEPEQMADRSRAATTRPTPERPGHPATRPLPKKP